MSRCISYEYKERRGICRSTVPADTKVEKERLHTSRMESMLAMGMELDELEIMPEGQERRLEIVRSLLDLQQGT